MLFETQPDGRVAIYDTATQRKIRVEKKHAVLLWLLHDQNQSTEPRRCVVIAYAVHRAQPMAICITEDASVPPLWPRWTETNPPPAWRAVRAREWIGLPGCDGATAEVLQSQAVSHRLRERDLESDMQDRCSLIQEGAKDEFLQTLDYYTTQRVKMAYLKMNGDGLRQRWEEVQRCLRHVEQLLREAPADIAAGWTLATDPTTAVDGEDTDPNALCVPQVFDYDV